MEPSATTVIEGVLPPPAFDASLAHLARPVVVHARPLLAASRALLLSLTMIRGRFVPVTTCWNGPAEAVDMRSTLNLEAQDVRRHLAALQITGQRLLIELARRWPSNAVPPAIGIVTDGGGLVFSSDHPSPLRSGWLALHQSGLCAPTTILPFSDCGAWARLTAKEANPRVH